MFFGVKLCEFLIFWDINPLSDKPFANIFFHSVGCLFILLIVSFLLQKLLVWCSPICLFLFSFPNSKRNIQKIFLRLMSKSVLPMFAYRKFLVSGHIFKSITNFELIFVYYKRWWSSFTLLHVAIQFSQHYLLKRPSFHYWMVLAFLSKIIWGHDLFLHSLF